jgi:hypothetical protein
VLILADEELESDMESVDSRSIISLLLIRDIRDKRRKEILAEQGPAALRALTCRPTATLIRWD